MGARGGGRFDSQSARRGSGFDASVRRWRRPRRTAPVRGEQLSRDGLLRVERGDAAARVPHAVSRERHQRRRARDRRQLLHTLSQIVAVAQHVDVAAVERRLPPRDLGGVGASEPRCRRIVEHVPALTAHRHRRQRRQARVAQAAGRSQPQRVVAAAARDVERTVAVDAQGSGVRRDGQRCVGEVGVEGWHGHVPVDDLKTGTVVVAARSAQLEANEARTQHGDTRAERRRVDDGGGAGLRVWMANEGWQE